MGILFHSGTPRGQNGGDWIRSITRLFLEAAQRLALKVRIELPMNYSMGKVRILSFAAGKIFQGWTENDNWRMSHPSRELVHRTTRYIYHRTRRRFAGSCRDSAGFPMCARNRLTRSVRKFSQAGFSEVMPEWLTPSSINC